MRDAAVFLFVDARRPSSPCDTSRKKATLAALTPTHCVRCCPFFRADRRWLSGKKATHLRCSDSFHSLLSHFPCRSLRFLGKSATLAALTPTHCVRCCPFFRADRRWLSGQDGGTLAAFVLWQQSQMAGEGCHRIYAACSIRRPEGYWHGAAFDVAAGV